MKTKETVGIVFSGRGAIKLSAIGPFVEGGKLTFPKNELLTHVSNFMIDTLCSGWEKYEDLIHGKDYHPGDVIIVTDEASKKRCRELAASDIENFIVSECWKLDGENLPLPVMK